MPGGNGANPKTFNVMDDGTFINLTTYFTSSPVYTVTTNPMELNFWMFVDGTGTYWNAPVNFALPYDSTLDSFQHSQCWYLFAAISVEFEHVL